MSLPPIPDTFTWTAEPWGAALRCKVFDGVATALFTTRQLRLPQPQEWAALATTMKVPVQHLRRGRQVHGRTVLVLRRGCPIETDVMEADALITDEPSLAIAVVAADCVPLLLADRRTGAVAAVHAGWRGTAAGVAAATVEALALEFGSRAEDLVAAIGPSIGSCCYEVGTDVVDAFATAGHERYLVDRWFMVPPPRRGETERSRLRFDVAGANRDQLVLSGVPEESIHVAGLCTAMHLDVLTSFRAERDGAGRIAGVIRMRASA